MNELIYEINVKNLICTISDHECGYSCSWTRKKNTLLCVERGAIKIEHGENVKTVSCGECILIPAGAVGVTYFREKVNRVFLFLFDTTTHALQQEITLYKGNHDSLSLISGLYTAYLNGENDIHYYLANFYMLFHQFYKSREIAPKFRKIHELVLDIERNYALNLSLSDYAKKYLMSKSNLRLLFRQYTGKSLIKYRNDVRVKRAEELILGGMTVCEAAEKVGFSSASYFCRIRKQT